LTFFVYFNAYFLVLLFAGISETEDGLGKNSNARLMASYVRNTFAKISKNY